VCTDEQEERNAVERIPLSNVDLEPDVQERLEALGVATVGDFLRLPADGLRQRFGASTEALHQLASGHRWAPLVPAPADDPQEREVHFDAPEIHTDRVIFIVKRLLDSLVSALAARALVVAELVVWMKLDNRTDRTEHVRPAAPTLDAVQLLALVRLRLDAIHLAAGIVTLRITAAASPATTDVRWLFPPHARRDSALADQALARVRAEFGEQSVVRARLGNGHLPASQFGWEPLARVPLRSSPQVVAMRPLVRRMFGNPLPLASFRLERSIGPYIVSGGWWGGNVRRDYYFAPAADGNLWWVYYDHRRRRFFLQGCVE
jgi:protein ImuB